MRRTKELIVTVMFVTVKEVLADIETSQFFNPPRHRVTQQLLIAPQRLDLHYLLPEYSTRTSKICLRREYVIKLIV